MGYWTLPLLVGWVLICRLFVAWKSARTNVIWDLLKPHCQDALTVRSTVPIYDVTLDIVVLDSPCDRLPLIVKPESWLEYSCSEVPVSASEAF